MLKNGNGNPEICAQNLLSIVRTEVPYDRVRGIDSAIVDMPEEDAKIELEQDALWNIETYEPRIDADSVEITADIAQGGDYSLQMHITEAEEDEEE